MPQPVPKEAPYPRLAATLVRSGADVGRFTGPGLIDTQLTFLRRAAEYSLAQGDGVTADRIAR